MVEVLGVGANLVPSTGDEANGIEGALETPDAHITRWYSAAIIHYTGLGTWRVGVVPTGRNRWEWFNDLSRDDVGMLLAGTKFRVCPTDELEEKLGIREST